MTIETISTTHVYYLLDRSGSMGNLRDDVIGGFNSFVTEQREDTSTPMLMTVILFDSVTPYQIIQEATPISEVVLLNNEVYVPRGGTPLLDATGRLLADAESRQLGLWENQKPAEKIIVMSFTDGEENSSSKFTATQIKETTSRLTKRGWAFVYMGANVDAYAQGALVGAGRNNSWSYVADSAGILGMSQTLNTATHAYRNSVATGTADNENFFKNSSAYGNDAQ